jgi:hypothetical protein
VRLLAVVVASLAIGVGIGACGSCTPSSGGGSDANPPPTSAVATNAAQRACANARKLGCVLGASAGCQAGITNGLASSNTSLEVVQCAGAVVTPQALEACGKFFTGACGGPGK